MHQSSMDFMIRALTDFVKPSLDLVDRNEAITVLDVGSYDVNGSYRNLFDDQAFLYVGLDIEEGPNVDRLIKKTGEIPYESASVELVVSGQMLEHAPEFWKIFSEMARVLKPGGHLVVIAPSNGPEHKYPLDCYRFLPDSFRHLGHANSLEVLEVAVNGFPPWHDLLGVFRKPGAGTSGQPPGKEFVAQESWEPAQDARISPEAWDNGPESSRSAPGRYYLDVLKDLHLSESPRGYLEVGVGAGGSLALAQCEAIGVDPKPSPGIRSTENVKFFAMTSDQYFEDSHPRDFPVDLGFIDGEHLLEFALRDFINFERVSTSQTSLVIDDVLPGHPSQASRSRHTINWTGDVWKLPFILKELREDLHLHFLEASPAGMLLVRNLDPASLVLKHNYNQIIEDYSGRTFPGVGELAELLSHISEGNVYPRRGVRRSLARLFGRSSG